MSYHDHTYSSNCPQGSGTAEFQKQSGQWVLLSSSCGKNYQVPPTNQIDPGNHYGEGDIVSVCCVPK